MILIPLSRFWRSFPISKILSRKSVVEAEVESEDDGCDVCNTCLYNSSACSYDSNPTRASAFRNKAFVHDGFRARHCSAHDSPSLYRCSFESVADLLLVSTRNASNTRSCVLDDVVDDDDG